MPPTASWLVYTCSASPFYLNAKLFTPCVVCQLLQLYGKRTKLSALGSAYPRTKSRANVDTVSSTDHKASVAKTLAIRRPFCYGMQEFFICVLDLLI